MKIYDTSEVKYFNQIGDNLYEIDREIKICNFKIGTVLFDLRTQEFIVIETEEDIKKYSYIAPELYRIMVKKECE